MGMAAAGCKKDDVGERIRIEGFELFDQAGNTMGHMGPADNDWQLTDGSALSSFERSLVERPDTAGTENTVVTAVSVRPYPNPVQQVSSLALDAGDSVTFKLVITDASGAVLKQLSKKIKGPSGVSIDLSNRSTFPSRKSLRYYYSFSAAGSPHFKVGYGDIKVCDEPNLQFLEECFR